MEISTFRASLVRVTTSLVATHKKTFQKNKLNCVKSFLEEKISALASQTKHILNEAALKTFLTWTAMKSR